MNSYENEQLSYECDLTAERDRLLAENKALREALEVLHTSAGELLYLCDRHVNGAKDYREHAKAKQHIEHARAALAKAK